MKSWIFRSESLEATARLGRQLGQLLTQQLVVALDGTLGSGKTTLVQSIAEGLGISRCDVVSPTFTICVPHSGRLRMLHVDAYRIKQAEEMDELGLDEEVDGGAVLLIEWANRVEESLPPRDLQILATPEATNQRTYTFRALTAAGENVIARLKQNLAST